MEGHQFQTILAHSVAVDERKRQAFTDRRRTVSFDRSGGSPMALLNCPDCGRQVSDRALACPQCGRPASRAPAPATPRRAGPPKNSAVAAQVHREGVGSPRRVVQSTLVFQHPTNNYVEESTSPGLWAFLFGFLYFASKGIWSHAVVGLIFAIPTFGLSWLIYAMFAREIVRKHYLSKGWTDMTNGSRLPPKFDDGEARLKRLETLRTIGMLTDVELQREQAYVLHKQFSFGALDTRIEALERLSSLREIGLVSEDEFRARKTRILL